LNIIDGLRADFLPADDTNILRALVLRISI
jgi:hypothetical protein